jgi:transposase
MGKGAGLVMPYCDSFAMNEHLKEISAQIDAEHHAVLILDQAGWHMSQRLQVPENITILPLPSKSPELNPVENLWQFMRDNYLSNRIFKNYDDIVDHCSHAWNQVVDQPWRIMSIGLRSGPTGYDQWELVLAVHPAGRCRQRPSRAREGWSLPWATDRRGTRRRVRQSTDFRTLLHV